MSRIQVSQERNHRRPQKMERSPRLMDWQDKHRKKWSSYKKQSTDSIQSLSIFQHNSSKTWKEKFDVEKQQKKLYQKQLLTIKEFLGESATLISRCTTELMKFALMKIAWYWYRNRQVDQWNRIENTEMNPHTYGNLIFDKEAKNHAMENRKHLQ